RGDNENLLNLLFVRKSSYLMPISLAKPLSDFSTSALILRDLLGKLNKDSWSALSWTFALDIILDTSKSPVLKPALICIARSRLFWFFMRAPTSTIGDACFTH